MNVNIEELKQKALAATPGPWSESDGYAGVVAGKQFIAQAYGDRRADCINNAAYIAAANPATILALIAERDELLGALKTARWWVGDGYDGTPLPREQMAPRYREDIDLIDAAIAKVEG